MKKVLVIGCPGSGKSTFARRLRDRTGLPLYPLDLLWHRPDKTTVSEAEFDAALAEILRKDRWIIDGNFSRTLERRLAECDTVFLFDLPLADCIAGVETRIGTKREDMRSSTRNSASLSRIFPRPGFPTSMRCWKSTGIKRSPYFIPAPSVKSIKYQRRKPDDSTLEDRYERNKPNRPFRPAVRGA